MANLPKYAFHQGKIVPYEQATVRVLTHGINYGTACFGGLRGYYNQEQDEVFVFRASDHYRRFLNSTRLLCMEFPYSDEDLVEITRDLIRQEGYKEDIYIRPLAYKADEIIGVRLHNLKDEMSIAAVPYGSYVANDEGLHVTISSWKRVDDNMIPARGKISGAYANSAFIKTDAQRSGFDEALVLTDSGHVGEGSAMNFFMLRDGVAVTPPITDNILEGITRRTVTTLLRDEMGMDVVERSIDRTEVYLAEEAFFTGTGVQIAAITRVDHRPVGAGQMGPVVAELRELFFDAARGRSPKYRHWCTPVYASQTETSPQIAR